MRWRAPGRRRAPCAAAADSGRSAKRTRAAQPLAAHRRARSLARPSEMSMAAEACARSAGRERQARLGPGIAPAQMLGLGRRQAPGRGQRRVLAQRQARAPHRRACRRRTARRPPAPCRAAPCGPRSTAPMTVMEIVSGPGRRSVSPPIRWQPKRACASAQAGGEARQPRRRRRLRERQRHQIADGPGGLGGEIGDVHRQRLPGDVLGRVVGEEVHALGHRIGLEHQLGARLRRDQRAVVLQAEGARRTPAPAAPGGG